MVHLKIKGREHLKIIRYGCVASHVVGDDSQVSDLKAGKFTRDHVYIIFGATWYNCNMDPSTKLSNVVKTFNKCKEANKLSPHFF